MPYRRSAVCRLRRVAAARPRSASVSACTRRLDLDRLAQRFHPDPRRLAARLRLHLLEPRR